MHAHEPFSGDYCKVMIWSRTMVRVLLNFGLGQIKQDFDISSTGQTLDDNETKWCLILKNSTLPWTVLTCFKDDPVQFNVDDKAVYVGGSYHDKNDFIGFIRSFVSFLNFRRIDSLLEYSKISITRTLKGN